MFRLAVTTLPEWQRGDPYTPGAVVSISAACSVRPEDLLGSKLRLPASRCLPRCSRVPLCDLLHRFMVRIRAGFVAGSISPGDDTLALKPR